MHDSDLYLKKVREKILLSLLVVIPLGFLTKFYSGSAQSWVNDSLGGVFYEIFWCLVIALIWVHVPARRIAVWVFGMTSILECLQLWHPHVLEIVRSTFIGRTLIGTQFAWLDFPHYLGGCLIGWFWIERIRTREKT